MPIIRKPVALSTNSGEGLYSTVVSSGGVFGTDGIITLESGDDVIRTLALSGGGTVSGFTAPAAGHSRHLTLRNTGAYTFAFNSYDVSSIPVTGIHFPPGMSASYYFPVGATADLYYEHTLALWVLKEIRLAEEAAVGPAGTDYQLADNAWPATSEDSVTESDSVANIARVYRMGVSYNSCIAGILAPAGYNISKHVTIIVTAGIGYIRHNGAIVSSSNNISWPTAADVALPTGSVVELVYDHVASAFVPCSWNTVAAPSLVV